MQFDPTAPSGIEMRATAKPLGADDDPATLDDPTRCGATYIPALRCLDWLVRTPRTHPDEWFIRLRDLYTYRPGAIDLFTYATVNALLLGATWAAADESDTRAICAAALGAAVELVWGRP